MAGAVEYLSNSAILLPLGLAMQTRSKAHKNSRIKILAIANGDAIC